MAVTHGNDPDVLEEIGDALRAEGERVQTIAGSGASGIAVLVDSWAGPDLGVFDASWGGCAPAAGRCGAAVAGRGGAGQGAGAAAA